MRKYLLPEKGNFYKANLHCHTTCSDGKLSPEQIKEAYKGHGYSVLAYTDHDILLNRSHLCDEDFLALNGYEMEITEPGSPFNKLKTCHICLVALEPDNLNQVCWHRNAYLFAKALNYKDQVKFDESLPDYVREYTPECINDIIAKGRAGGFFVTYNHPGWSLENYPSYSKYEGMNAMEIYNGSCINSGYPTDGHVYDDMLRLGRRIFCIGSDDNHNLADIDSPYSDSFMGYTVIKAERLDYRTVTKALENGHFYASMGPEIHGIYVEDGVLTVKCSEASKVVFSTAIRWTKCEWENGVPLTEASFKLAPEQVYVRATVFGKDGLTASTNAYFLDEIL